MTNSPRVRARRGRQPSEKRTASLSLRVNETTKAALVAEASANSWTVSRALEERLAEAAQLKRKVEDLERTFGIADARRIARLVARAVKAVQRYKAASPLTDRWVHHEVSVAVAMLFDQLTPGGPLVPPELLVQPESESAKALQQMMNRPGEIGRMVGLGLAALEDVDEAYEDLTLDRAQSLEALNSMKARKKGDEK